MNHEEQLTNAYNILIEAYERIENELVNPLFEMKKTRLLMDIKRIANPFAILAGIDLNYGIPRSEVTGEPLKTFMGNVIPSAEQQKKEFNEIKRKSPQEVALRELKDERDLLFNEFPSLTDDEIIDSCNDHVIRAVAKKVGLPVTDSNPNRITISYIREIREAMNHKKDIEQLAEFSHNEER